MKNPNHKRIICSLEKALFQLREDAGYYGYFDEKDFQAIYQVLKVYKELLEQNTPERSPEPFYDTVSEIDESWSNYDKRIANIQETCFGQIFLNA